MTAARFVLTGLLLSIPIARADYGVKSVASGFERPVWAGMPPGSSGKLWVMEQAGRVHIVDLATGRWDGPPFLDIRDRVKRKGNEEGLLGLAFDRDFMKNGRYYINYTDLKNNTSIVRLVSNDGKATDPGTAETILEYPSEFENHNGGWVCFGPDGMLYIGNGDGGSGNDPHGNAQNLGSLLGKILRIDVSPAKGYKIPADNPFVNKPGAKPEIWAYGVRNPWRNSFDRGTGDFWMGDVGQNHWEEINFMPAGKGAGANYGWRLREGAVPTPAKGTGGPAPVGAIDPIYVYGHGMKPLEGLSVTGGYVYRGKAIPELRGRYIFADYQNPRFWSFVQKNGKAVDFQDITDKLKPAGGRLKLISTFAEDNQGELFFADHTGAIYQIVPR